MSKNKSEEKQPTVGEIVDQIHGILSPLSDRSQRVILKFIEKMFYSDYFESYRYGSVYFLEWILKNKKDGVVKDLIIKCKEHHEKHIEYTQSLLEYFYPSDMGKELQQLYSKFQLEQVYAYRKKGLAKK